MQIFKISSQDITNLYLIDYMTRFKTYDTVHGGLHRENELKLAVDLVRKKQINFLFFIVFQAIQLPTISLI